MHPGSHGRNDTCPATGGHENISMSDFSLRRAQLSFAATGIEPRSAAVAGAQHLRAPRIRRHFIDILEIDGE
jgi:hypothetical protein